MSNKPKLEEEKHEMHMFLGYSDEKINELFNIDLKPDMVYQESYGRTKFNIIFTEEKQVLWFAVYKGKPYGNLIYDIRLEDPFQALDYYLTVRNNAIDTLKALRK